MRRALFPAVFRRPVALLAFLGLAVMALAAGCGGGDDNSSALDRIKSQGTITVGTKFDQPLFGLRNLSGEPQGFDVEIAKIIAKDLGVPENKIKFVETVSANREEFIKQGKVDIVVATYTINDKRKQSIDFAGPYYVDGQSLMVRAGETTITSKDTLTGKKVCSVSGSTSAANIRKEAPGADFVLFDVYSKCAEALKNGQVDAVSTDRGILQGLMSKNPGKFKLAGEPFSREPYGIGLKKGDDALRAFINDTLEKAFSDGRWERAYTSTIGKVEPNTPTPPRVDRYTRAS
jgi:glutamate transport system substrate-binding protein